MNTTIAPQKSPAVDSDKQAWDHKDLWIRRARTFAVEVSRHSVPLSTISPELGPHRWCVYAYIYPAHPHFNKFDFKTDQSFFQPGCSEMPFHGVITGASYLRYHYAPEGKVVCVQVGADYNHLYDERFTHLEPEDAGEVFDDAETLFRWLTDRAPSVPEATESASASSVSGEADI